MKLNYKINLVMVSILVMMTVALVVPGTIIISNLAFKFQDQVLNSELETSRQMIEKSLNHSGIQAAIRVAGNLQANLEYLLPHMETIQVSIFEPPDRVVFHQGYTLGKGIQWPELKYMFKQREGHVEYVLGAVEYYSVFKTIQPINWLVVHTTTKKAMLAKRREYFQTIGVITVVILVLSAWIVNILVGRFVWRIQNTLECVKQIEKGNLDALIQPITVEDEIGSLQAGVNAMSARIKQRMVERQKAEETLHRYEYIISSTNDLMSFVDKDYTYLAVNDAYLNAHGKKREDIVGFTVESLMGTETFQKLAKPYLDRALNGERIQYQLWFEYKSIGRCFMDVTYYPFKGINDGEIGGVVVAAHDLTHRRQSEQEVQKKEEKLRFILDSIPDMIIEIDSSFKALWANKTALDSNPEAIGLKCHEAFQCHQSPCEGCLCAKAFESGKIEVGTVFHPASETNGERYQENIWVPLKEPDGRVSTVLALSRNVTDRELARKRELHLQKDLVHARKMESIGTLAGGIAHDFNNILSIIIGYTELSLEDVEKDSIIEGNLRELYSAGKRAKDLVRQILTFARQSEEKLNPIQIKPIVKEVLKFIRSTIPTTIEIRQNITSDALIMGSTTHIHQILMNLFTNAAHAMEKEGGILTVNVVDADSNKEIPELEKGEYLKIEVSDTGSGIEPKQLEKIFEPYFTTKEPGRGTGMGLAMVHGIVESYHGKINVRSQRGQGTTFSVFLPVIRKKRRADKTYGPEKLPTGAEHILFVDDEVQIAKIGAYNLEKLGYSVTTCTNSADALGLFRNKPYDFDLVISDITMPKMTGDILAAEMLAIRPDIPVILCTGYSRKISDDSITATGIKAFVYKPIVKSDLARTVRAVLDASKAKFH